MSRLNAQKEDSFNCKSKESHELKILGFYSFEKKNLIEKSLLEISCTITINLILKVATRVIT